MTPGFISIAELGIVAGSAAAASKNRLAIQNALDAGGLVFVPPGEHWVDGTLTLRSGSRLMGVSPGVSILRANHPGHVLQATDAIHLNIERLTLKGLGSGTGHGVYLAQDKRSSSYVNLRDVEILTAGGDGVHAEHLIVSSFDGVVVNTCGGNGFSVLRGTSTNWRNTYAVACGAAGYVVSNLAYSTFTGTAVDKCKVGYELVGCNGVVFSGCGCESIDGVGLRIDSCYDVVATGLVNYDNRDTFVRVTGNSSGIGLHHVREVSATTPGTCSIHVEPRCGVNLTSPKALSPMDLAPSTTVFVDSTRFACKTGDTARIGNTLTDDPELFVYLQEPRSTWIVQGNLPYSTPTGAVLPLGWTMPNGARLNVTTKAGSGVVVINGLLTLGTATGNVGLQWAQGTLYRDSFLELRRVA